MQIKPLQKITIISENPLVFLLRPSPHPVTPKGKRREITWTLTNEQRKKEMTRDKNRHL